ncbi:MAG: hypothetical protein WC876_06130 [Candidatus Thermoplasmatota archaeon]
MKLVLVGLLLVLPAGCLDLGQALSNCDAQILADEIDRDAPSTGGPGPRAITIQASDADGTPLRNAVVAAWWEGDAAGQAHGIRLRAGTDGQAVANVPTDRDIHLMAGQEAWTHEGLARSGDEALEVALLWGYGQAGSVRGTWEPSLSIGAQTRTWDPHDLPWADPEHLANVEAILLVLTWENRPQGSADFGIALGRDGLDQYWNSAYQTSLGQMIEVLLLSSTDLNGVGLLDGDRLQAGPSISTGAYATEPIAYELSWNADYLVEGDPGWLCGRLGKDARLEDVTTSRGDAVGTSGRAD